MKASSPQILSTKNLTVLKSRTSTTKFIARGGFDLASCWDQRRRRAEISLGDYRKRCQSTDRIEGEADQRAAVALDIGDDRDGAGGHGAEVDLRIAHARCQRHRAFANIDNAH